MLYMHIQANPKSSSRQSPLFPILFGWPLSLPALLQPSISLRSEVRSRGCRRDPPYPSYQQGSDYIRMEEEDSYVRGPPRRSNDSGRCLYSKPASQQEELHNLDTHLA